MLTMVEIATHLGHRMFTFYIQMIQYMSKLQNKVYNIKI